MKEAVKKSPPAAKKVAVKKTVKTDKNKFKRAKTARVAKAKAPKYEEKFKFMGNRILEITRSTERKSAFVKIVIDDEFARKLMNSTLLMGATDIPEIVCFGISYREKV